MKNYLKLVVLLFFIVPYSIITAQAIYFGVKGGINLNSIGDLRHYGVNSGGGVKTNPTITVLYKDEKEFGTQFVFIRKLILASYLFVQN